MANIKSSKKRIKVSERNRLRNRLYKSTVRTMYKKSMQSIQNYNESNKEDISKIISITYSKIDKAVKKKVLHANSGASKKSSLSKALKKALSS
jgi:small subunit ribosomal protein S20